MNVTLNAIQGGEHVHMTTYFHEIFIILKHYLVHMKAYLFCALQR